MKREIVKKEIFIGHIDTVGISDYDTIKEYATKPLELEEKLKEDALPEN